MQRRKMDLIGRKFFLGTVLRILLAVVLLVPVSGIASSQNRILFHLTESHNVGLLIESLKVYLNQLPDPANAVVVVVAHGPAVGKLVNLPSRATVYKEDIEALQKQGVSFEACALMMRSMELDKGRLLPGVTYLEAGGLARVLQLQADGFTYIHM